MSNAIFVITYYTLGDSIETIEIEAESIEKAIDILIADEPEQYCYAQLKSYTRKEVIHA